jgi:hypothetical protein
LFIQFKLFNFFIHKFIQALNYDCYLSANVGKYFINNEVLIMTTSNNTVDLNAQGWYLDSSPTPLLGTWNNQSNEVIVNTNDPTAVQVKSNDTVNTGKGKDVISGTATNNTAQDVYGVLIAGILNANGGNDSITGNATGTQVVNGILVTGILNTGTGNDNITGIAYGSNQIENLNDFHIFGIHNNQSQINLGSGNNQLTGVATSTDAGNTASELTSNGQNIWSFGIGNETNIDSNGNPIGNGSSSITAGDGNNLIEGDSTSKGTLAVQVVNGTQVVFGAVGIHQLYTTHDSITVGNGNNRILGNATTIVSPNSPVTIDSNNLEGNAYGIQNLTSTIKTGNGNKEITGNASVTMSNFVNSGNILFGESIGIHNTPGGSIVTGSGNDKITGNDSVTVTADALNEITNDGGNTPGDWSFGIWNAGGTIDAGGGNNQITGNANLVATGKSNPKDAGGRT